MKAFDAVVIGAGPAGSTAAIRLAQAGRSVALVEKAQFPRRKVCGEFISATTWPLLEALGVGGELGARGGPAVRRVALFAGDHVLDAPMPRSAAPPHWGRAVGREWLDTALRDRAAASGVQLFQPWRVEFVERGEGGHRVAIARDGESARLDARHLVIAYGSWERQAWREWPDHGAGDLLGFKAHFHGSALPRDLMPLVLFPGGYGGMVATDADRVSFSCCVRRDALAAIRTAHHGRAAGEAVIAHAMASSRGVREALAGARCEDAWLAAGPIRPGIRDAAGDGVFAAGNAAGEAHPLVAEGISMAIQSGWLAAEALAAGGDAAREYRRAWRRHFATRVRASSIFAAVMMRPWGPEACARVLAQAPRLLTWGAWWSGKSHRLPLAADPA